MSNQKEDATGHGDHTDPYCVSHCGPGSKHSQCGCTRPHRATSEGERIVAFRGESDYDTAPASRHNHMTRDIKPRGQCPACDAVLAVMGVKEASAADHVGGSMIELTTEERTLFPFPHQQEAIARIVAARLVEACPTCSPQPLAASTHEPVKVFMLDGWQFVKCSCGQNPTPNLWVAEHWHGDRDSGETVLRALIAEQANA